MSRGDDTLISQRSILVVLKRFPPPPTPRFGQGGVVAVSPVFRDLGRGVKPDPNETTVLSVCSHLGFPLIHWIVGMP